MDPLFVHSDVPSSQNDSHIQRPKGKLIGGIEMAVQKPSELIFQELSSFAKKHDLNLSVKELSTWAERVFARLNGQLVTHKEAAAMLGVSPEMMHHYRKDALIEGIPKNPHATKPHWLYQLCDVLQLKSYRANLRAKRHASARV